MSDRSAPAPERPLAGVLVVDLSRNLPGPLVGRLLGDLGARVLKIEEPGSGDPARQAPPLVDGRSSLGALLMAGHQCLALDLKKTAAREVLDGLLESADVLVESFRPGTLERLGLEPRELRRRFPRLVVCSVSGWGQAGPHAQRAGHDLGYQAVAGSLAGGSGVPAVQVADLLGGWSAASAVLAALLRRERGGEGCWIDQSLLDAAGHANLTAWAAEADRPRQIGERLLLTGALPCYDLYRARDGRPIALAALEPRFWRRFCKAAGRRDLLTKQYATDPAAKKKVADLLAERTAEQWQRLFDEYDIPAEKVLSAAEAREHPQVAERGLLRRAADGLDRLGFPALFDGRRPRAQERYAELGADTYEVLEEFGLAPEGSRLRRRGIGRRLSLKRWATKWAAGRRKL